MKTLMLLLILFVFSCKEQQCKECTMHKYSIPYDVENDKTIMFMQCNDVGTPRYWNGGCDTVIVNDVLYITEVKCK